MRRSLTNSTALGDISIPTQLALQLVGGDTGRSATAERVKDHYVAWVGGWPLMIRSSKRKWFLSRIAYASPCAKTESPEHQPIYLAVGIP